jgi:hypothetical protein
MEAFMSKREGNQNVAHPESTFLACMRPSVLPAVGGGEEEYKLIQLLQRNI